MIDRGMLVAGTAALALSVPALAQEQQGRQVQQATMQQGQGAEMTVEVVPATQWTYEGLERGLSADSLLDDADIYNERGDEIGELEDMVVGPDGTVRKLIIESGGFLDIGDVTFAYPVDRATIEGPDRIVVQIPGETDIDEDYSLFAGEPVEEGGLAPGPDWRISRLLNDYAYMGGGVPYGWVRDAIISRETLTVEAIVVSPDVGYGSPGVYAFPYHDWRARSPQDGVYQVPYTPAEVEAMETFVYPEGSRTGGEGESRQGLDSGGAGDRG